MSACGLARIALTSPPPLFSSGDLADNVEYEQQLHVDRGGQGDRPRAAGRWVGQG